MTAFSHVFKEMNHIADKLSKLGLQFGDEIWQKWECDNDTILEDDPKPFNFLSS